jgi:curved DNA-binding protein CbpA
VAAGSTHIPLAEIRRAMTPSQGGAPGGARAAPPQQRSAEGPHTPAPSPPLPFARSAERPGPAEPMTPPPIASAVREAEPPRSDSPRATPVDEATRSRSRPASRSPRDPAVAAEVRALIARRTEQLAARADHYTLLGVAPGSAPSEIRRAYFAIARQLHPDRLAALGIADDTRAAHRLFAHINTAFAVLSDPARRTEYDSILRRGGEAAVREEQARAEELAQRLLAAEEAFARGEVALRREQLGEAVAQLSHAIELAPDEVDYHVLLAWAQFCAAPDKSAAAGVARRSFERAIARAPEAIGARFYLGRVERMLGRDREALLQFQEVIARAPQHAEAASEIRMLEARLGQTQRRR